MPSSDAAWDAGRCPYCAYKEGAQRRGHYPPRSSVKHPAAANACSRCGVPIELCIRDASCTSECVFAMQCPALTWRLWLLGAGVGAPLPRKVGPDDAGPPQAPSTSLAPLSDIARVPSNPVSLSTRHATRVGIRRWVGAQSCCPEKRAGQQQRRRTRRRAAVEAGADGGRAGWAVEGEGGAASSGARRRGNRAPGPPHPLAHTLPQIQKPWRTRMRDALLNTAPTRCFRACNASPGSCDAVSGPHVLVLDIGVLPGGGTPSLPHVAARPRLPHLGYHPPNRLMQSLRSVIC